MKTNHQSLKAMRQFFPGQRVMAPVRLTRMVNGRIETQCEVKQMGSIVPRHAGTMIDLGTEDAAAKPVFVNFAARATVDQLGDVLVRLDGGRGLIVRANIEELEPV